MPSTNELSWTMFVEQRQNRPFTQVSLSQISEKIILLFTMCSNKETQINSGTRPILELAMYNSKIHEFWTSGRKICRVVFVYSLVTNKQISRVILSQNFYTLTEFVEKSIKIYDIKFVSLDIP